ncbi:E3 ubiquitin-protein ligase XIAP-like isoform X2 [Pecten maximus]|uniref:E3 ubiquitin-protein ligase XIAP-like isoform X2 n=1 Tax=Pecten maximus TaxID=6579 RepID=UPI001458E95D|nr:E3 ubiquitin-protein ligase XIAP-like isoform X2 [Pecten maximus]
MTRGSDCRFSLTVENRPRCSECCTHPVVFPKLFLGSSRWVFPKRIFKYTFASFGYTYRDRIDNDILGKMSDTISIRPRRNLETRSTKILERHATKNLEFCSVGEDNIGRYKPGTIACLDGSSNAELENNSIENGDAVFPDSRQLQELVEKLVGFNGEDTESLASKQSRPSCVYFVTRLVRFCEVIITSQTLIGSFCITVVKHSKYTYSLVIRVKKPREQGPGSKTKCATSETVFKVTFHIYPDNITFRKLLSSVDVICRSSPRRKSKAIFKKALTVNSSVFINEEVIARVLTVIQNQFRRNLCNYRPIEQSVTLQVFDTQRKVQNASSMSSLFSSLSFTSSCELARPGLIGDNNDRKDVVDSSELKGNSKIPSQQQDSQECSVSTRECFSEEEQEYPQNDGNKNANDRCADNCSTVESVVYDNTSRTPGDNSLALNPEVNEPTSFTESVPSGEQETDVQSNRRHSSPDFTQNQAESVEVTETIHSDVTSESDLIETASGGADHLMYSPRNPLYTLPESRRLSFRAWTKPQHNTDILVDSGFFFTGEEDIVRCFHCDIGLAEWDPEDDPWVEHARHSPDCPFLKSRKDERFINNIQLQWAQIYSPKHPHMDTTAKREESFKPSWPQDFVMQTPRQLAQAGFFYTGATDTVRCHYCDGGLREWEPNDDPWTEHARWFPLCKFVIKIKGLQFIQNSAVPENVPDGHEDLPAAASQGTACAPTFVEECKKKEWKNPLFSAASESVLSVGYSKSTVKEAIMLYIERTGRRDFSAKDLMEIAFELEEQGRASFSEDIDIVSVEEEFQLTPTAMKMENRYLKEKLLCVTCKERERCMLFIPCGHRITCGICSKEQKICPVCSSEVTRAVKTFLG